MKSICTFLAFVLFPLLGFLQNSVMQSQAYSLDITSDVLQVIVTSVGDVESDGAHLTYKSQVLSVSGYLR